MYNVYLIDSVHVRQLYLVYLLILTFHATFQNISLLQFGDLYINVTYSVSRYVFINIMVCIILQNIFFYKYLGRYIIFIPNENLIILAGMVAFFPSLCAKLPTMLQCFRNSMLSIFFHRTENQISNCISTNAFQKGTTFKN